MGKTQEEIEFDKTLAKLRALAGMPPLPEEKPKPERPIKRPFPIPKIEEPEQDYFDEPETKPFKKLPTEIKFDIPEDKKKANPWIYVSVFAIIALVALGGYFTYTLSKQTPPTTNLNTSLSCPPVSCGANSCGACTCTPVVEGSNITCMPATINIFNNGTEI